jgi:uncharacterized protein (UPF0335 family)
MKADLSLFNSLISNTVVDNIAVFNVIPEVLVDKTKTLSELADIVKNVVNGFLEQYDEIEKGLDELDDRISAMEYEEMENNFDSEELKRLKRIRKFVNNTVMDSIVHDTYMSINKI